MPTRNISLTREQDAFVEEAVRSGRYQNASEAVRDAIRTLQARMREEDVRLDLLRSQIAEGIAAMERGEFSEIAPGGTARWLESLTEPGGA